MQLRTLGNKELLPDDDLDLDGDGNTAEDLPLDLLGFPRNWGKSVDIGACECQEDVAAGRELPSAIVTTLEDTVDCCDGAISLREAILYASCGMVGPTVTFDSSLSEGEIVLDGRALWLGDAVSIDASMLDVLTIDADGNSRVFVVNGADPCEMIGLTITGGGAHLGVSLYNYGELSIVDCAIIGGSGRDGENVNHAIFNEGVLVITQSTIAENNGGGIYNAGTLTIADSNLSGNTSHNGGGVYNAGLAVVTNSTIFRNVVIGDNASGFGGGVYNRGTMELLGCTVSDNSNISYCGRGGGIANGGVLTVIDSVIVANSHSHAHSDGGGVYSWGGSAVIVDSTIAKNTAGRYGGGIVVAVTGEVRMANCELFGNSAGSEGGGIYNNGSLAAVNCTLSGNSTDGNGGGISNVGGTVAVASSTIAGNSAEDYAGGVHNSEGDVLITNSIVALNASAEEEEFFGQLAEGSGANLIGFDPGFVRNPDDGGDGWGDDPETTDTDEGANDDFGDFHLEAASFAVDLGNRAFLPADVNDVDCDGDCDEVVPLDLDGTPRVAGEQVDIGAYEYQGGLPLQRETPATVVTTTADVFDPYDGLISLREAVFYAGRGLSGDRVTFEASLTGREVVLDDNPLVLHRAVTIDASALESFTVNAKGQTRVFDILSGWESELIGLTVTGGMAEEGGGIRNQGVLKISHTTVVSNTADQGGGIYNTASGVVQIVGSNISRNLASGATSNGGGICNFGNLSLVSSLLFRNINNGNTGSSTGCGGGIHNANGATLVVVDSTLSGNMIQGFGAGGGISNWETATIVNSTFIGNAVNGPPDEEGHGGGGVHCDNLATLNVTNSRFLGNWVTGRWASGAGIYVAFESEAEIVNSVFCGNLAIGRYGSGAGIYSSQGRVTLTNSTVTANVADYKTGGIVGSVKLNNSIVALNQAPAYPDLNATKPGNYLANTDPLFVRNPSDGGDGWADDLATPNIDESANNDYGDLHLRVGSPAIDAGDNSLLPADEFDLDNDGDTTEPLPVDLAGEKRVVGASVDLGAYEGGFVAELVVSMLVDENDGDYSDGDLSLREAMALAATYAYDQVITFSPDLFVDGSQTIVLDATLGQLEYDAKNSTVDGKVIIKGPGADLLTIDADGNSRVFAFISSEAKIEGLTIAGGDVREGRGGGVFVDAEASVEIIASTITRNVADLDGGGVFSSGKLLITDSRIAENVVRKTGGGGGIYNAGELLIANSMLLENTVQQGDGGGGVFNNGAASIVESTLAGNIAGIGEAGLAGGGVFNNEGCGLRVTNSQILGNSALSVGAGIFNFSGSVVLTNSVLVGNTATAERSQGAAIYSLGETMLVNSTVTGNTARGKFSANGGIYAPDDQLVMYNSIVSLNTGSIEPDVSDSWKGNSIAGADPLFVRNPSDGGDGWIDDPTTPDVDESANNDYGDLRLQEGSPGVDAGSNSLLPADDFDLDNDGDTFEPLPVDVAGEERIIGSCVDMGAHEGFSSGHFVVSTLVDENDGDYRTGDLSLREALLLAAQYKGDERITFDSALIHGRNRTITLDPTLGPLEYDAAARGTLRIDGPGADRLSIDAQGACRVFHFTGSTVVLRGLTISGGVVKAVSGQQERMGGGVLVDRSADVHIQDTIIRENSAYYGGAVAGFCHSSLTLANTVIVGNVGKYGGGLYLWASPATVTNATITGNEGDPFYSADYDNFQAETILENTIVAENGGVIRSIIHGSNNLFEDPLFARNPFDGGDGWVDDPATLDVDESANNDYGDLRLQLDSPAIDAGSNELAVDADGNPLPWDIRGAGYDRIVNDTVDIGAYEYRNAVSIELHLVGTDGDDTFEFTAGATAADWVVKINGEEQIFPDTVEQIFFDGREGNDQVTLIGTDGADTAVLEATAAELSGSGYAVFATNVENPTVYGRAGEDTITFYDNAGRNQFVAGRGFAGYLTGFAGELRSYEFELVTAYATDGIDEAKLYDSAGDDVFVSDPNVSTLTGGGMTITVHDFQGVHAYATLGGTDKAYFTDTALDDQVIGTHEYAIMWSPNYEQGVFNRSKFFEESYAVSSHGGADIVKFYDGPGDDAFVADEHEASFTCVNKYTTSSVFVEDFVGVHAFASTGTGYDTATFYDSTGNDEYYSDAVQAALWNTSAGWYNRAKFFERTDAYATAGGTDKATLYDSTFDDNLLLDANSLTIYGADNGHHFGTSFRNRIELFDTVYAKSIGGTDVLELEDSNGADTLEATGHQLSFFSAEHNLDYVLEDIAQTTAKTDDNNTDTRKVLDYLFDIDFEGRWRNAP